MLFAEFDTDGSGLLDKQEVKRLTTRMGEKLTTLFNHKKLDDAFAQMDKDNSGGVGVDEFVAWVRSSVGVCFGGGALLRFKILKC